MKGVKPEWDYGKTSTSMTDAFSRSDMSSGQEIISSSAFELVNKDATFEVEARGDTPVLVLPKKVHKHVITKQFSQSRPQTGRQTQNDYFDADQVSQATDSQSSFDKKLDK
jgi:hypothetical protein